MAHEVNNPLGAILALTGLTVEDMSEDDPNRENLEEVMRQTERCRDIVRGLLEFSRKAELHPSLVDLNKVLSDTLSLVAKQALFLNIGVVRRLDPALPPVLADRNQFEQVFMNIIMNAVQAMDERGEITIATRLMPPSGASKSPSPIPDAASRWNKSAGSSTRFSPPRRVARERALDSRSPTES